MTGWHEREVRADRAARERHRRDAARTQRIVDRILPELERAARERRERLDRVAARVLREWMPRVDAGARGPGEGSRPRVTHGARAS